MPYEKELTMFSRAKVTSFRSRVTSIELSYYVRPSLTDLLFYLDTVPKTIPHWEPSICVN